MTIHLYLHLYSYKKLCAHGNPRIHIVNVKLPNPLCIHYNKQTIDSA